MIQLRFATLLNEKRERDHLRWSLPDIHRHTGLSTSTLRRWYRGNSAMLASTTLITLCEFLKCDIGDLVVYVEDEETAAG